MVRKNAAKDDDLTDRICTLIRSLSAQKPAQFFAFHGEIGQRQAERILGGWQPISWPVLRTLLTSEYASRFHWALMESFGAHPYWSDLRHQMRVANLREQKRALDQELKELEAKS